MIRILLLFSALLLGLPLDTRVPAFRLNNNFSFCKFLESCLPLWPIKYELTRGLVSAIITNFIFTEHSIHLSHFARTSILAMVGS